MPFVGARVQLDGRASTDAHGAFQLRGVANGHHELHVRAGGVLSNEHVVVVDGSSVEILDIVERSGAIVGRVLGLAPSALLNLQVTASNREGGWRWSRVRPDGRYRIDEVGSGEWTVEVGDPAGEHRVRGTVAVRPGNEVILDLELAPGWNSTPYGTP